MCQRGYTEHVQRVTELNVVVFPGSSETYYKLNMNHSLAGVYWPRGIAVESPLKDGFKWIARSAGRSDRKVKQYGIKKHCSPLGIGLCSGQVLLGASSIECPFAWPQLFKPCRLRRWRQGRSHLPEWLSQSGNINNINSSATFFDWRNDMN